MKHRNMQGMYKKITAAILSLALLLGSMPLSSLAEGEEPVGVPTPAVQETEASSGQEGAEKPEEGNDTDRPSVTTYYEVSFALPPDALQEEVENCVLPETQMLPEKSPILAIPEAKLPGYLFLGWTYDEAGKEKVPEDAVVEKNMTLYPRFGLTEEWDEAGTDYVVERDVPADYVVEVVAYGLTEEQILERLAVHNNTTMEEVPFYLELVPEPEPLDLESLELEEKTLAAVKEAIQKKKEKESFELGTALTKLNLDSKMILQIVKAYAPKELEEEENKEEQVRVSEALQNLDSDKADEKENDKPGDKTDTEAEDEPESTPSVLHDPKDALAAEKAETERDIAAWKELLGDEFNDEIMNLLTRAEVDYEHATAKELMELYGLSEDDSLQRYWREELGLDVEEVQRLEDLIMRKQLEESGRYRIVPEAGAWEEGCLIQVEILNTARLRFVYQGTPTRSKEIYYNFTVFKENVNNVRLKEDLGMIPASEVEGVDLKGLVSLDADAEGNLAAHMNEDSGILTYTGSRTLSVGEEIAVYDGVLREDGTVDGSVGYFTLTEDLGGGRFAYGSADPLDVLLVPDVIPVPDDGSYEDGQILLSYAVLDFSAEWYRKVNLDENTKLEAGDYLTFYTGNPEKPHSLTNKGYGHVTAVQRQEEGVLVSYEPASEQDLIHSFEMFLHLGEMDLELTEEEEQTAVESMLRQMEESHILRETQDYLVGVLTDNELPLESLDNRAELENMQIRTENGEEMKLEDLRRLAGVGEVEVTDIAVFPTLSAGPNALVHFKDENGKGKSGIRGTVNVTFTIKIQISESGALHISPVLALEQEFMLDPTISMKLRWDTYFGIPYVSGVYVDAALDTGTYTGIGICVTAKTVNAPPEADWDGVNNQITEHILGGGNNDSTEDLKLSIAQKLIEAGQKLEKKDEGGTGGQGNASVGAELPEKYSAMLANNATYVDMVNEPIGEFDIGLDPTQIVHIGAVVSLVVRMKINAMIGTGAYFEIAKRYSFHIVLEENGERNAYGSESDLTPAHLRVDFYAFGMVGVKLGVRLDLRLGVISTKFASVGLVAEVGAYAELYGFLYAMYDWKDGKGSWSAAGSLLFTTGLYVELSFKLQIGFDSVSWQAGIWSKKLELWHFGDKHIPLDFEIKENDPRLKLEIPEDSNTIKVTDDLFKIKAMSLETGVMSTENKDSKKVRDDEETKSYSIVDPNDAERLAGSLGLTNTRSWKQYNEEFFTIECHDLVDQNGKPAENGTPLDGASSFQYLPASNEIYVRPIDAEADEVWGEVTFTYKYHIFGFNTASIKRTVKVHWKGINAHAVVVYYLQPALDNWDSDTWTMAGTGEVDGFEEIRYDIVVDTELVNKFPGYRLDYACFPDEKILEQKLRETEAAYDEAKRKRRVAVNNWIEAVYGEHLGDEDYFKGKKVKEWFEEAGLGTLDMNSKWKLWEEASHLYWDFMNHNKEAIAKGEGTLYFIMRGQETVIRLLYRKEVKQVRWDIMEEGGTERIWTSDMWASTLYSNIPINTPILDSEPGMIKNYRSDLYETEWYAWKYADEWTYVWKPPFDEALVNGRMWTRVTESTLMPEQYLILIGVQKPKAFPVTWMAEGEKVAMTQVRHGSKLIVPEEKDRIPEPSETSETKTSQITILTDPKFGEGLIPLREDGYILDAWITDTGEGIDSMIMPTREVTVFASWKGYPNDVEWIVGDTRPKGTSSGSAGTSDASASAGAAASEGQAYTASNWSIITNPEIAPYSVHKAVPTGEVLYAYAPSDFDVDGYSIVWRTDKDDLTTELPMDYRMPYQNMTLYGRYTTGFWKVTWMDENTLIREEEVAAGSILSMPELTPVEGQTIVWEINGNPVPEGFTMPQKDITIRAIRHTHDWVAATHPATCKEEGSVGYECSICHLMRATEVLPVDPDNHVWEAYVKQAATCKTEGILGHRCSLCGKEKEDGDEAIPLDASHHEGPFVLEGYKALTCAEEGYTGDTVCSACGERAAIGEFLPVPEDKSELHVWGGAKYDEIVWPTCKEDGYLPYRCTICGEIKYVPYPANAGYHQFELNSVITPSTCSVHGKGLYTCRICGAEEERELELDPDKHNPDRENPAGSTDGTVDGSFGDDGYIQTTFRKGRTAYPCKDCGTLVYEEDRLISYELSNIDRGAATIPDRILYEEGKETLADCKDILTEIWPVHYYDNMTPRGLWYHLSAEISWADGYGDMPLSSLQSGDTVKIHVKPTGADADYFEEMDAELSITHSVHVWVLDQMLEEATCCTWGEASYHCSICQETKTDYLDCDPNNHAGGTRVIGKVAATCQEAGSTGTTICRGCGEVIQEATVIPMLSHVWDEGIVTVEPTCVQEGVRTYTCTLCKETYTDSVPVDLDNHPGETEITGAAEATCTEAGSTGEEVCVFCGQVIREAEVIPALGHDWQAIYFKWSADMSQVTATHSCGREGCEHHETPETETVTPTVRVEKEPTDTEPGEKVYTAAFENPLFGIREFWFEY